MDTKNLTTRIIRYLKSYLKYRKQTKSHHKSSKEKAIIVQISDSRIYKRYFYTLLKFFAIEGYSIYFPNVDFNYYKNNIYNKPSNLYRLTFDEQFVIYNTPPNNSKVVLHINDKKLNPDYFSNIILKEDNRKAFHIPMAMHPLMYNKNLWNAKLHLNIKKKKSVFMVGSLEHPAYSSIKDKPFSIESRSETYHYLKKQKCLKKINSKEELNTFINSNDDFVCILLDGTKTPIPIEDLRKTINNFSFYLALPGVFMPLCHNLIEAMSTGAIPIIHITYGNLMTPKLKHMYNAIFYYNLQDLEIQINLAYKMDETTLKSMENNVIKYYKTNLTPRGITHKIISNRYDTLYLLSGMNSVEILQENLNTQKGT